MSEKNSKKRETKRILISRAVPGMVLAADVYTRSNQVILNAGSELDAETISKIMFYAVDTIIVYAPEGQEENHNSLTQQLKNTVEFREFSQRYDDAVNSLEQSMKLLVDDETPIDEDGLIGNIDDLLGIGGTKTGVFNMLSCIRDYDEPTYMHSVNVSLIANCFGRWLALPDSEIRDLTLAGLLHDAGKLSIPREILLKPDSLTEDEYKIMQTHTMRGYEALRNKGVDENVARVALRHHERADGSGYPGGIKGEDNDPLSMIVAIADVYDAMTSDRVYRPKICPFEVIHYLAVEGASKYDPKYLIPLLEQISQVYINHTVRLSDGTMGKIIIMNSELERPIVQVDDLFVDLSRNRELKIEEVI